MLLTLLGFDFQYGYATHEKRDMYILVQMVENEFGK